MRSIYTPYVAIKNPIRYFLALFLTFFGALHLINDVSTLISSETMTDSSRLLVLAFLVTIVMFGSRLMSEKKAKRVAEAGAAK